MGTRLPLRARVLRPGSTCPFRFALPSRYSRIVGGWDLLPRALMSSLPGSVVLNSPVVAITQGMHNVHVHVATPLQSPNLKMLTADQVLLTATGPALQRITFSPPLSRRRQEALRSLHYVAASKVFLSFRRPFWLEEHIEGGHSNTDRPSRLIFYPAPGEGALLLASYTWSDAAAPFAGLSADQAMRVALKDVASLHGPAVFRLWDGTGVVKRWAEDPHSQGGFVVQPPLFGQTDEDFDWSSPYGRIYFAGEHTAHPHGWVETAVKSALRAAVKINNHGYGVASPEKPEASLQKQKLTKVEQKPSSVKPNHLFQETSPSKQQPKPMFVEAIPELQGHVFGESIPEKGHTHLHQNAIPKVRVHGEHRHAGFVPQQTMHLRGEAGRHSTWKGNMDTQLPTQPFSIEQTTHNDSPQ